jgi:uncharacterized protein
VNGGAHRNTERFRFAVKLTPKGGRDAIDGWASDAAGKPILKARVSAPPEEGKANAALIELIASALKIKKADIKIVSGTASRTKLVEVQGDGALLQRLHEAAR